MGREAGRIRGFDGLRAVAVLCVFLTHRTTLGNRLELGSPGVWMFFVLSGFLIIGILHRERQRIEAGQLGVGSALARFIGRRIRRIFPVYYLALLTLVPLLAAGGVVHIGTTGYAMMTAYLTNVWIGEIVGRWPGYIGHLWSLAVEEQFYLLMPLIALPFAGSGLRRACLGIVAAAIALKLILTGIDTPRIAVHTNSIVNFGMIAFGGWCALTLRPGEPTGGRTSLAIAAPFALYFAMNVGGHLLHAPVPLFQFSAALVGLGLVAIARNQASLAVRLLELPPLTFLGRISYGFYVYHPLVSLDALVPVARAAGYDLPFPARGAAVISFAIAVLVAWLSWRFIERPLLDRSFGRDAPLAGVSAAPS